MNEKTQFVLSLTILLLVSFLFIFSFYVFSLFTIEEDCKVTYNINDKIFPKLDNPTYNKTTYNCVNFSEKAKEYFEDLGYNVSIVQKENKEKSNDTFALYHAFIRINEPIYIYPQIREIVKRHNVLIYKDNVYLVE